MAATLEIHVNGTLRRLPAPGGMATVADLIEDLGFAGQRVAVELNGAVVPRTTHAERVLMAGDRVEVVTFVGGG